MEGQLLLNNQTKIVQVKSCLSTVLGQERILLETTTGIYFGLNELGGFLWDKISSPHNLDDLILGVTREFEVSKEVASSDTIAFIDHLYQNNLVSIVDEASS